MSNIILDIYLIINASVLTYTVRETLTRHHNRHKKQKNMYFYDVEDKKKKKKEKNLNYINT